MASLFSRLTETKIKNISHFSLYKLTNNIIVRIPYNCVLITFIFSIDMRYQCTGNSHRTRAWFHHSTSTRKLRGSQWVCVQIWTSDWNRPNISWKTIYIIFSSNFLQDEFLPYHSSRVRSPWNQGSHL